MLKKPIIDRYVMIGIIHKMYLMTHQIKIVFSVMILSTIGKLNASITLAKHSKMPNNIIMITPQTCDTEGLKMAFRTLLKGKEARFERKVKN